MSIAKMAASHRDVGPDVNEPLAVAIGHIAMCALSCTSCADACAAEPDVEELRQCIRLCLDCADVCTMLMRVGTRHTGHNAAFLAAALELCADICEACAEECERHHHLHCSLCAEACRKCAEDCRSVEL